MKIDRDLGGYIYEFTDIWEGKAAKLTALLFFKDCLVCTDSDGHSEPEAPMPIGFASITLRDETRFLSVTGQMRDPLEL